MSPICCGWIAVPRNKPSEENAAAPRTVISSTVPKCPKLRFGIGPMINRATGSTKSAETIPCNTPAKIFSAATIQMGSGASRRSSISFVHPKSCTIGNATD